MTFKALLNWGGFGNFGKPQQTPIERWHGYVGRGGHGGPWDHKSHGHGHYKKGGGKGGGNGAAISALTLLAFLFLLNVMQQSLNDNNITTTTTASTIFLRDEGSELTARDRGVTLNYESLKKARDSEDEGDQRDDEFEKGDTLGFDPNDPYP
ncbi:uncharacterized protein LOC107042201 [Diachasma alloeum]|uniref:uncharacterized protein LOC107042201 n=1 Tax=Diachasma alloeum TaxID=454923 RepID=UPI0007381D35|nr:uncharacterized protein LOC107042201 [Diachasma alloeum]